jgi:Mo25-like
MPVIACRACSVSASKLHFCLQALSLLAHLLMNTFLGHEALMFKYIKSANNLMLIMNLLRVNSRIIQFEAFHVFKVCHSGDVSPPCPIPLVHDALHLTEYLSTGRICILIRGTPRVINGNAGVITGGMQHAVTLFILFYESINYLEFTFSSPMSAGLCSQPQQAGHHQGVAHQQQRQAAALPHGLSQE